MSRRLYITGEISIASYGEFSRQLGEMEDEATESIEVEIHSDGGDLESAIAYYSRISESSCRVDTTVYGTVSSSAVLILAAGHKRKMHKNAWVMVHQSVDALDDTAKELRSQIDRVDQLDKQYCALLAASSNKSVEEWEQLNARTTYLSAEDCRDMGLVEVFGE